MRRAFVALGEHRRQTRLHSPSQAACAAGLSARFTATRDSASTGDEMQTVNIRVMARSITCDSRPPGSHAAETRLLVSITTRTMPIVTQSKLAAPVKDDLGKRMKQDYEDALR